MNHGNDGKKDNQQGCKGQRLFKRMSELVFLDNAVEGSEEHNNH